MVNINIKLIFQIFHFFIMWFFLDRFLFSPVVKLIMEEESFVNKLKKSIKASEFFFQKESEKRDFLWKKSKEKFKKKSPNIINHPLLSSSDITCPIIDIIDKDRKKKLIIDSVNILTERIIGNDR